MNIHDVFHLEIKNLTYERQQRVLFKALNLTIKPGELLHIVGANGSGKTSLLRLLCGLSMPTAGEIHWCGLSIDKQRAQFGEAVFYLAHENGMRLGLTAYENLALRGTQRRREQCIDALRTLGVFDCDLALNRLSAGQQRRVALVNLLLSPAKLWVLDEPFTALDQQGVSIVTRLLEQHIHQGGSVVLTAHHALSITNTMIQYLYLGSRKSTISDSA